MSIGKLFFLTIGGLIVAIEIINLHFDGTAGLTMGGISLAAGVLITAVAAGTREL